MKTLKIKMCVSQIQFNNKKQFDKLVDRFLQLPWHSVAQRLQVDGQTDKYRPGADDDDGDDEAHDADGGED